MSETKKLGKLFVEELEKRIAPAASAQGVAHASDVAKEHANSHAGFQPVATTFMDGEETGGGGLILG